MNHGSIFSLVAAQVARQQQGGGLMRAAFCAAGVFTLPVVIAAMLVYGWSA